MGLLTLYHSGYQEIRSPDVHYGRRNADFGQGFYLTEDRDFACIWAREKKGSDIILNQYELDCDDLLIHRFGREEDWYEYILENRTGKPDRYRDFDVIIGPIANDTIYDTSGIIFSGFLSKEEALTLLRLGPQYTQITLKTERAVSHLSWKNACIISPEEAREYRKTAEEKEKAFQKMFAETMLSFAEDTES